MTFIKQIAVSLGLGVIGYFVGMFAGIALVYWMSSNQHDRSVEAAMTGAFFIGPIAAVLFAIIAFFCTK